MRSRPNARRPTSVIHIRTRSGARREGLGASSPRRPKANAGNSIAPAPSQKGAVLCCPGLVPAAWASSPRVSYRPKGGRTPPPAARRAGAPAAGVSAAPDPPPHQGGHAGPAIPGGGTVRRHRVAVPLRGSPAAVRPRSGVLPAWPDDRRPQHLPDAGPVTH